MNAPNPPARRTSLTQFGGAIATRGEPELAQLLKSAWQAATGPGRELTHGFHSYPARSHPGLVRTLVHALSRPGDVVVDPFCGSGTTLVESYAAGRRALGCDVNGVAIRLARVKSWPTDATMRRDLLAAAERIAGRGSASVRQREGRATLDAPAELRSWFEPHVWRELDVLGRAIDDVRSQERHGALLLVLSSLLTKVSLRRAETSEQTVAKRLAPGFTSRLFAERARELVDGLADLAATAGRAPRSTRPLVAQADARALPFADGCAQLVLTSPPYLGTYDYSEVQTLRARLLSIPLTGAQEHEIGARTPANDSPVHAAKRFGDALAAALGETGRVVAPGGTIVVVIGDSSAGGHHVRADELIERAAGRAGLALVAAAAQERREESRREHLLALRRRE